MMESSTIESPLDVLSRAATMLRQGDRAAASCKGRGNAGVGKDVPSSARWRRERRPCPLTTTNNRPLARPTVNSKPLTRPTVNNRSADNGDAMAPLDMSTRRRQESSGHVTSSKPRVSVITCAPSSSDDDAQGLDSDPVIDEHFRRSLGRDYLSLFPPTSSRSAAAAATSPRNSPPPPPPATSSGTNSNVTLTGLSVDDHFAKALGETWLRLQAGEKSETNNKVITKSAPSSPVKDDSAPSSPAVIPLRVST